MAPAVLAASAAPARTPKAPPPTGELVLDLADPIILVKIGHVPLRLRVGLEQKRLIELNPAAVERLRADPPDRDFRFEDGFDAQVGRETLKGIEATAAVRINHRDLLVLLSSHGRDCCPGADGEIGIGLLPYATIRFVRPGGVTKPRRSADFLIEDSDERGPETMVPVGARQIAVQFAFDRPDSVATASAGAILATVHGGHREGQGSTVAAFGVMRPTTTLILKRPAWLAGFRFDRLPVRTADFAGHFSFPEDPDEPGDIVVRRKTPQQQAWPVMLIGRDRLDRCSEARYDTIARRLTLRCAYDDGPS
jgi:hypothetical protein